MSYLRDTLVTYVTKICNHRNIPKIVLLHLSESIVTVLTSCLRVCLLLFSQKYTDMHIYEKEIL